MFDRNKTTLIQYPIAIGGSYQVPGTVVAIGDSAFGDAFGLNSVIIPNSVTNIAQQAFYGCLNLSNVALGEGVTSIGPNAFFYCGNLVNLVFPASVTSLGQYSFGACQKLSSVCFAGNAPANGGSVFYFDRALSTIPYVNGTVGWEPTYDGIPTVPRASCGGSLPELTILRSAGNVVLTWPAAFAGFSLESTTNLVSPAAWTSDAGAPVMVNNTYTAARPVSRLMEFFRLSR